MSDNQPERSLMTAADLRFFEPQEDYTVSWKRLPHWTQAGCVVFVTWRTLDSIPAPVMRRFERERDEILAAHGISPQTDWKNEILKLSAVAKQQVRWEIFEKWDTQLDNCHGRCVLRRPELSLIVADSLLKFDGDRYFVTDFVVMPNHVHLLVAFRTEEALETQCRDWKRFTARNINQSLKEHGDFWQVEAFDHLVRSEGHFERYRRYIASNPAKARLKAHEFRCYRRDL